jgi:diguanylate cyclase (GGDEF)-like protein
MSYLFQFQINLFALAILVALNHIIRTKSKVKSFSKMILKFVILFSGIALVFEPLTWIFDGEVFPGAFFLEYSTNFILYILSPILGGFMLSYVDYHVFKQPERIYKKHFYQQMTLVTFVLLIVNFFYPIYFSVSPGDNRFHGGPYENLHYAMITLMYFYMVYLVLKNRKRTTTFIMKIVFVFFGLPVIGMIIQLSFSHLHFSWALIVLALLVAYIYLETTSTDEDYLTHLFNRKSYELYTQHLIELNKPFSVILIDLNDFKHINDHYGHHKGDQVLIQFSQILLKVFSPKGFVSRLGGDEFIVVLERPEHFDEKEADVIRQHLLKSDDPLMHSLSFSYGYKVFSSHMTMDELYASVDREMYQFKAQFKARS